MPLSTLTPTGVVVALVRAAVRNQARGMLPQKLITGGPERLTPSLLQAEWMCEAMSPTAKDTSSAMHAAVAAGLRQWLHCRDCWGTTEPAC